MSDQDSGLPPTGVPNQPTPAPPVTTIHLEVDEQSSDALPPTPGEVKPEVVIRATGDRRASVNLQEKHRNELEIEERRFRYWLMKVLVLSFCIILVMIVGAMIYGFVFKSVPMNESVLSKFLETLTEILKVLKPDKPGI